MATDYRAVARQMATKYGIDPRMFQAQIAAESGFDVEGTMNANSAGAIGIAQIVPRWHPGVDPRDPIASLEYAAKWDAQLLKKYDGSWKDVLSVYNSGGTWNAKGSGIAETRNYVAKIFAGAKGVPSYSGPDPAAAAVANPNAGVNPNVQGWDTTSTVGTLNNRAAMADALRRHARQIVTQGIHIGRGGDSLSDMFRRVSMTALSDVGTATLPVGRTPAAPKGAAKGGAAGTVPSDEAYAGGNANTMLATIRLARSFGLSARENPATGDDVDPVHTTGSFHYQLFPGTNVGRGLDVSGNPDAMMKFYQTMMSDRAKYGVSELFYTPGGWSIDKGKPYHGTIAHHDDHVHVSI